MAEEKKASAPAGVAEQTPPLKQGDDAAAAARDPNLPGLPKVLEGVAAEVDNHKLPQAPREYAGRYELTHGTVRIAEGVFGAGTILQLNSNDGKNLSDLGVATRVED